jgi:hypothetical protein
VKGNRDTDVETSDTSQEAEDSPRSERCSGYLRHPFTKLGVGSFVFDNDFRHPAVLAKDVATLDVLSDGRFELGMGAGWYRGEYEQVGIPFDLLETRHSRLEEAIRVMKRLFSA